VGPGLGLPRCQPKGGMGSVVPAWGIELLAPAKYEGDRSRKLKKMSTGKMVGFGPESLQQAVA